MILSFGKVHGALAWAPARRGGRLIRNSVIIAMLVISSAFCAEGQEPGRWNFHVGGGIGFPQATTGDFVGDAAHLEIGAGPNLTSHVGIAGEFM